MGTRGRHNRAVATAAAMLAAVGVVAAPGGASGASPSGPVNEQVLVFLRSPLHLDASLQGSVVGQLRGLGAQHVQAFHLLDVVSATVSQSMVETLRANPAVASVQPDRYRTYQLDNGPSLRDEIAQARSMRTTAASSGQFPPTSGPNSSAPCGLPLNAIPGSPLFNQACTHEANDITRATEANAAGYDGSGVVVADIDTGFDVTHPNLNVRANGVPGPTFRDQANFNESTPGAGPVNTITDFFGHGTGTASQIIAQGNIVPGVNPFCVAANTSAPAALGILDPSGSSNYCIFFKGMAPGATLIPIEALGITPQNLIVGGTDGELVRAVQWAVDHGADLINESFSGVTPLIDPFDPLGLANSAAVARGVAVFSAMGNDGPGAGTVSEGAINPDVISVGAEAMYRAFYVEDFINAQPNGFVSQNLKDWSSRAPGLSVQAKPDIIAPGAFGWANFPMATAAPPLAEGQILGSFGGTSQATPVALANAALVIQAYEKRFNTRPSPALLKALLKATARDLGYSSEYDGAGAIDSMHAIDVVNGKADAVLAMPSGISASGYPGDTATQSLKLVNFSSAQQMVQLAATHETALGSITGSGVMTSSTAIDGTGRKSLQLTMAGGLAAETNTANFGIPAGIAAQNPELMHVSIDWRDDTDCTALRVRAYNSRGQWIGYGQQAANAAPFGQNSANQPAETLAVGHHTELTWNLGHSAPTIADRSVEGTATGPFQILVYARNGSQGPGGANTACGSKNPASIPIVWKVSWLKRTAWSALTPPSAVSIPANGSVNVSVPVTFPALGDGTAYGNLVLTTAGSASQVPVLLRVKVPIVNGSGTFYGALTGSEKEYFGGEWFYYQFDVPPNAPAVDAWVTWPDAHNQVFGYLISPDDQMVVSKYSSYPDDTPPIAGNTTRAVHMTQADPQPGLWTVVVYGYGFYGGALREPFYGTVRLSAVAPPSLALRGDAGQTVTAHIPVENGGGADYYVEAVGEKPGFHDVKVATISGQLPNTQYLQSNMSIVQFVQGSFVVPPDSQVIHATATSSSDPIELDLIAPDISYWASGGGSRATTALGGPGTYSAPATSVSIDYAQPSRGAWIYDIAYSNPGDFTPGTITGEVHVMAPDGWDWVKGVASAQDRKAPSCSASGGSGAYNANCGHSQGFDDVPHVRGGRHEVVDVPISVPAGTANGIYSGTIALTTVDGDVLAHVATDVCVGVPCPNSAGSSSGGGGRGGTRGIASLPNTAPSAVAAWPLVLAGAVLVLGATWRRRARSRG